VDTKNQFPSEGRTSCLLNASLEHNNYNNLFGYFSFVNSINTTKGKAN